MSYPRRPNAPTLPVTRTRRGVPYSNAAQPDVASRDQPFVEPERQVYPYTVANYDSKPVNADMFYETFTGVAAAGDESISSADGNLVFGDSSNGFVVPNQRRFIIRGVELHFYSGFPDFYDDTPYGIAPGFASPGAGGASWSLTLNGNPVPGMAQRAIVGGPGELQDAAAWIIAEQGWRVSITMRFPGQEVGGDVHAVYGKIWGDDLFSDNRNLPLAPVNVDPIPVEA